MFEIPFGTLLREARQQAGMTCQELGQLVDCGKRRISAIERAVRFPSQKELDMFLDVLPLDSSRVHRGLDLPSEGFRSLIANARRLLDARPYFPPSPEPAFRKFLAAGAAFPEAVRAMTERLRTRPDFHLISLLTGKMRFDSADEVLNVLHILDVGATPALHPPNTCGAPPARIIDKKGKHEVGHRPHACLIYQNLAIFPQVSFATTPPQTVDLLVWDGRAWRDWEVDGGGHVSRWDNQRKESLGIPVHRYSTEIIERAARRREPYFAEFVRARRAA